MVPAADRRVVDLAAGDGVLLEVGCLAGWTSPKQALGLELDPDVVRLRPEHGPRIEAADGLLDEGELLHNWGDDIVVGNPPFGRSRDLLTDLQRRRLETEPRAPRAVWGPRALGEDGRFTDPAGSCRVEELFLERAQGIVP